MWLHIKCLTAHKNSIRNSTLRKWHHLLCWILQAVFWYSHVTKACRVVGPLLHYHSKSGSRRNRFASHFTLDTPQRCWFQSHPDVECQNKRGLNCGSFSIFPFFCSFSLILWLRICYCILKASFGGILQEKHDCIWRLAKAVSQHRYLNCQNL